MVPGEYERRRRAIEKQYLADLELIRAGYQARLRALEALRLTASAPERLDAGSEMPASVEQETETLASNAPQTETPASAEAPSETPVPIQIPPEAPQPSPPEPIRRYNVVDEILATLPRLPEVFDKSDVVRLLGYEPNRPTLHRAWQRLREQQKIEMAVHSDGRRPMKFRKLVPE